MEFVQYQLAFIIKCYFQFHKVLHHLGLWKTGEFGEPVPHKTIPVKVIYPPESREGIWGGEGYIVGQRFAHGGDIVSLNISSMFSTR